MNMNLYVYLNHELIYSKINIEDAPILAFGHDSVTILTSLIWPQEMQPSHRATNVLMRRRASIEILEILSSLISQMG